MSQTDIFST